MHFRNPYKEPPDFAILAEFYPKLRQYLIPGRDGHTAINFRNNDAQRALTEALMLRDFSIRLTLPAERLCPPVPNRLNYILWLQDIVRHSPATLDGTVRGLDVGTGASAIYPLLACKLESKWTFIATDVDKTSYKSALLNVARNDLQERIKVQLSDADAPLFKLLAVEDSSTVFSFTMCNPPFYATAEEVSRSAEMKHFPPNAACTGADVEMITNGGEARFVRRMVEESSQHPLRCRWYTSMLGKLSSLMEIVDDLKGNSVDNYAITEFTQGQTRRWAVGWSFYRDRLPDSIARIGNPNPTIQGLLPGRNTVIQPLKNKTCSDPEVLMGVINEIKDVSVQQKQAAEWDDSDVPLKLIVEVTGDTWSRKARRANKSSQTKLDVEMENWEKGTAVSVFSVGWKSDGGSLLVFQWVRGEDRALFMSFSSYVTRKVQDVT
ncbi:S-adenosyl-L-methionine dependent methyltransferase [Pleurotus eryngii]|uniref:S-adenosyl-L-methionine dependent methyltransferase n=1 Tax=Pleurotus eryngii TaxID=5323 RepID=A0A9P5ZVS0_PLEER|nr:S-adenosyl-L-methionine dependent methyltransferase [Pleurotus eryngii]